MGENIDETTEWVANVKSGYAPGLPCWPIRYCPSFCEETFVGLVDIIYFNRQIRHGCTRTTFSRYTDLRCCISLARKCDDPSKIHHDFHPQDLAIETFCGLDV